MYASGFWYCSKSFIPKLCLLLVGKRAILNFFASVWFWISWNLTNFQLIRTTCIPHRRISSECLSEWAKILQVFMKFKIKQMLKISAFYLDKQKSFIPKKKWSVPCTMDSSFIRQQMPYCLATLLVYMAVAKALLVFLRVQKQ